MCDSKLMTLANDTSISSFQEVLYVDDFSSETTFTDSKAFDNFTSKASTTTWKSTECELVYPYIKVESKSSSGTNDTKLTYEVSDNVKLEVP